MRVGLSWLREYVTLPADLTAEQLDLALNNLGKVVRVLRPNLLVDTLLRMLGIDGHAEFSHQRPQ